MRMLSIVFEHPFLQRAILTGILSSIVCGVIGVIVIEKKLIMMSAGIAHTAYGGVGLGIFLDFEPIIGAFGFAVVSALGIGYAKRKSGAKTDVIIGLLWSFGMACGILFIGLTKGIAKDISSYLFGNILTVTKTDIIFMSVLSLLVVFIIISLFAHWKSYLFDEEFATVTGINTAILEYLLLILIAMTVVVLIRSVGIILIIALLTAPAATASLLSKKLKMRIVFSIIISLIFTLTGLYLSYILDIASGATIVFVSVITYFITLAVCYILDKSKQKKAIRKSVV